MNFTRKVIICLLSAGLLFSCDRKGGENNGIPIDSYVILVSFDAFRWDYMDLYETPNFHSMAASGVKAKALIPCFPTKTFPNHYTLATGLYPDKHGIINNSFYAEELNGIYRIGDRSMVGNPGAYSGEPIWLSAEKQGLKSACFFWVGSEAPIGGDYPSYWKKYDESIPYMDRVDQVISWLKMPLSKRPGLITLYFDEPDAISHDVGPEHRETGRVVESLDLILGSLRAEIAKLEIADKVNLIVLSDHGMADISPDRYVNITEYLKQDWTEQVVGANPVYLIDPSEGYEDSICMALDALEGVSAWEKEDIPAHLNYGSHPRFPGILVLADSLWSIGTRPDPSGYAGGAHGYDQRFTDMHSIFLAEGPAFKKDYIAEPFSNVEVYGIIASILGLSPAQTDGDLSNVSDLFREK